MWGGDWPHPRVEGEMPDVGHLLELFQEWTPIGPRSTASSSAIRQGSMDFRTKRLREMSVNNKRVFYVKYLAHPIYTEILQARPDVRLDRLEKDSPDEIAAPIVAAAHAYQIGAARDELARHFHVDHACTAAPTSAATQQRSGARSGRY